MAQELPYCSVAGKLPELFKRIADAKVPDTLSHAFLKDTLGFKSSNDRNLLGITKALGLVDKSGKPTARYRELKNTSSKGTALASGIREAYAPLFDANENAYKLPPEELKGLIAQVAGTDKEITNRISYTLNTLIKEADFDTAIEKENSEASEEDQVEQKLERSLSKPALSAGTLASQFHFNIQVHLPNNGTEETYLNIFNALRESFQ